MSETINSGAVTLVGAGKMGLALLEGWSAHGLFGDRVTIVEPSASPRLSDLCEERGYTLTDSAAGLPAPAALVLAIKPQMLDAAAPALQALAGADTLVVSILAGKRIADLAARLPSVSAFVRAMPNTPASIGRGVTGAYANAATNAAKRETAQRLLEAAGAVEWVDSESLIDSVTAVSGSGPAYVFYLAECLAEAGVEAGLPLDLAMRLARATVAGAGELLHRSPEIPAKTLRENVTSPGGTTAAALDVLMQDDGLAPLFKRAVAAAKRRAGELSG